MDNNNNSCSEFGEDPFDSLLLENFMEPDPTLVYLSFDNLDTPPLLQEKEALPQHQNDLHGVEQSNVPLMDSSTIQYQPTNCNDKFTIPDLETGCPRNKRKHPFTDDDINFPNGGGVGNFEPGGPSVQNQPENENRSRLRYWPPIQRPLLCTACQVLRQIIHTNASDFEILEIHGSIGHITHALFYNHKLTPAPSSCSYEMIDFLQRSTAEIKRFLDDYCKQKKQSGYITVEDPFSGFYEALCTRFGRPSADKDDDLIPQNVTEEETEAEAEAEAEAAGNRKSKRSRREQMERIKAMTMDDLSHVFHLTMAKAAIRLDISLSGLKSVCRRLHIVRWPQRQLPPLARNIIALKRALNSPDPEIRQTSREAIRKTQRKIINTCGGVAPTGFQMMT